MSDETSKKGSSQLAATLFMEVVPNGLETSPQPHPLSQPSGVNQRQMLPIIRVEDPDDARPQTPASTPSTRPTLLATALSDESAQRRSQPSSIMLFLREAACDHPFLFGLVATCVVFVLLSIAANLLPSL